MGVEWLIWYTEQSAKQKRWAMFRERYLCPCCYMPTLTDRARYAICSLCFWEDDGQDSDDADTVRGGPNGCYSLTEARANFRRYRTMYRPSDHAAFAAQQQRLAVNQPVYLAFYKALRSDDDIDWKAALKVEKTSRRRR